MALKICGKCQANNIKDVFSEKLTEEIKSKIYTIREKQVMSFGLWVMGYGFWGVVLVLRTSWDVSCGFWAGGLTFFAESGKICIFFVNVLKFL